MKRFCIVYGPGVNIVQLLEIAEIAYLIQSLQDGEFEPLPEVFDQTMLIGYCMDLEIGHHAIRVYPEDVRLVSERVKRLETDSAFLTYLTVLSMLRETAHAATIRANNFALHNLPPILTPAIIPDPV